MPDGPRTTLRDPEWRSLTQETTDATQSLLTRMLGQSRRAFNQSALLMQGQAGGFLEASPRDRKASLSEYVDPAGVWPAAYGAAHSRVIECERALARAQAAIDDLTERIVEKGSVDAAVGVLEGREAAAREDLRRAEHALDTAQAALAANAAQAEKVARLMAERDHAKAEHKRASDALWSARYAADALTEAEALVARLRESAARVPALEQEAQDYADSVNAAALATQERDVHVARAARIEREADEITSICHACKRPFEDAEARREAVGVKFAEAQRERDAARAVVIPDVPAFNPADLSNARTDAARLSGAVEQARTLREQAAQVETLEKAERDARHNMNSYGHSLNHVKARTLDQGELERVATKARDNVTVTRTNLDVVTADLARARERIATLEGYEEEIAELRQENEKTAADLEVYRTAERAFGRDGIPLLLAETVLPQLEADVNAVLREFPTADGTVFQIRLETQKANQDGSVRDELYVVVSAPDFEQDYDTMSGGEEARIASCFRLGLAETIARLRGARSMWLAVDELAFLDQGGGQALARLVSEKVANGTFSSAYVVAHEQAVIESFDQVVRVAKADGVSRIEEAA